MYNSEPTPIDFNETLGEKLDGNNTIMQHAVLNKSSTRHSSKKAAVRSLTVRHTNHACKTNKTC